MVSNQGRIMRALALGVTTVLLLAACQGATATPTPGAATPAPTGVATPAPTDAPVATPTAAPMDFTGGTLYMLMGTDVANGGEGFQDLDPQRTYTGEDLAFLSATINRTLTSYTYSPDAVVASGLMADAATDIGTASADAMTWSFTVRDGIMWQDGSALLCEDFKFGASRVYASDLVGGGPTYASAYLDVPSVDGFTAILDDENNPTGESEPSSSLVYVGPYTDVIPGLFEDEALTVPVANDQAAFDAAVECTGSTITYHLKQPIADFNYTVTLGMGAVPNPVDHPDADASGQEYNSFPWSNGPYMIESFERGIAGHLTMVRNPHYDASTDESGRMAYPDKWEVIQGIEPSVMDTRLITPAGDDSFAVQYGGVEPQNLATLFADPQTTLPAFEGRAFSDYDPYSRYQWIDTQVVTNPLIRQAMAVALDRDAIRNNGGGQFVGDYADGTIKPNIGMDYAPTNLWNAAGPFGQDIPDTGDIALALSLIAASGEAAPTLDWNYVTSEVADRTAGIVQDSLQQAGFTVNLKPVSPYYSCVFDPDCRGQFGGAGWGPDWPNASTVISPLFTDAGGWNLSNVQDADFVDAVNANLGQGDRALQAAEWQRLNSVTVERMYVVPTFFGLAQNIAGDKIGNLYRWGPYGSWPYAILYVNNQ